VAEVKQFNSFQARYPAEFIDVFAEHVARAVDAKLVALAELEEAGQAILDALERFQSRNESAKISCCEMKLPRMKETIEISSNCVKIHRCSPWSVCRGGHSGSSAITCCHRHKLVSGILVMRCTCVDHPFSSASSFRSWQLLWTGLRILSTFHD
jgi:hypothetical protein